MPDTFEAIAVILVALLPGATFIWAVERITGAWGARAADRILRFAALSLGLQLLISPVTYWAWVHYVRSGLLVRGEGIPPGLYLLVACYVLAPYAVGTVVGRALLREAEWARWLFGFQGRPPRAWDYVWRDEPARFVKLLLKTDPPTWVAGYFGSDRDRRSYIAPYPEEQDIFLVRRLAVHPRTGRFLPDDDGRRPKRLSGGLLVRWDEVHVLEIHEAQRRQVPLDEEAEGQLAQ